MYISIYDENKNHISNLHNATYSKTLRTYDKDNFSAEGISSDDVNNGKIAILNDELGNYEYACFVDGITPDKDKQKLKGLDFKSLWDTEILLDYTAAGSFDGRLSKIFEKIKTLVFDDPDIFVQKIPVTVIIPTDNTNTTQIFGSLQDTYKITNAYTFLKAYLKYYEYVIESHFDFETGKIIFEFVKHNNAVNIGLSDFIYELTTTTSATNKTVATIKYEIETDEEGQPTNLPRPSTLATVYYYLDKNNNIVQNDETGDIDNRIYPVVCKYFESEYLADAQFDAVYELVNSRFIDNIVIDNSKTLDPLNLDAYPLYTKVSLYYKNVLYKTLPISEKITTFDGKGKTTKIKLGFKKILLTEIIKKEV